MAENRRLARRWALLAIALILAAMVAVLTIWGRPLYELVADQDQLRARVEQFGPWGPFSITALEMAQTLVAPIPGQAIEAASGYLFGPWLGTLYAMAGITAGSLLNFFLARRFGRPLLIRLTNAETVARLDDLAERGGSLFFFLLWLFPLVPDDLACLASGLTPMPASRFLVLMILGRFPGILVSTWLGANAAQISPTWWIVLLVCLTLVALAFWRWGKQIQAAMLHFLDQLAGRLKPQ